MRFSFLYILTVCLYLQGCINWEIKATGLKDKHAIALYKKSIKARKRKDWLGQAKLLSDIDKIEADNPEVYDQLSQSFYSLRDYEAAVEFMTKAIKLTKDSSSIRAKYWLRGHMYRDWGKVDSACMDWQKGGKWGQQDLKKYCE